jgi:hypothetical protein
MTAWSASLKLAIAVSTVALAVGLAPRGGSPRAPADAPTARPSLDATSYAEARQLRLATRHLAAELAEAARCPTRESAHRFVRCATPGLRHAGIGGRTTAMLARGVVSAVPPGRCREYLFGLQAANDAAGDEARWLYSQLFAGPRRLRETAVELGRAARMLDGASRAAGPGVCAPGAGGPAA